MIPDSIFFQTGHTKEQKISSSAQTQYPDWNACKTPTVGTKPASFIFILGPLPPPPSIAPFFPACLAARLQLLKRYLPNLISRRPPQLPCTFPHTHWQHGSLPRFSFTRPSEKVAGSPWDGMGPGSENSFYGPAICHLHPPQLAHDPDL